MDSWVHKAGEVGPRGTVGKIAALRLRELGLDSSFRLLIM